MPKSILIVSSLDTKGQEVKFLKELIEQRGQRTVLLDMSTRGESPIPADIPCGDVARAGGASLHEIRTSAKGRDEITSIMIKGAIKKTIELYQAGKLGGIVGVGGVSNTTMGTEIMKALPFGVPKLMVSSGAAMPSYAGGFFGSSDITIISSVVDMAGLHELSKSVLIRAAGAICGMVETGADSVMDSLRQTENPLIAMTEFQYSGTCCELIRQHLEEKGYTVIPCHADGVGDRAMDKLLDEGIFDGVVDIVPAGLSEELFGGNRAAGPDRLEATGRRGVPQILTPCGFEMISCGPIRRKDSGDPLWLRRDLASRN
ncbi:MAG: Tm-1-like ATP-binding domain-containing protein, partial [Dehalococcoidia bacterium]|nr:Tm-1-like ATP-binding domain-containing protein [Dehalococcoidia bacterium]